MIEVDAIEKELMLELEREGLWRFVDPNVSQFLDLSVGIAVQVVLRDAFQEERVTQVVAEFARRKEEAENVRIAWLVRSIWSIKAVGRGDTAYGTNGWPIPATAVPVVLISGTRETTVTVLVTMLAIESLRNIIGASPDVREPVRAYVESFLARGGSEAWNPLQRNVLEINQDSAVRVYRLLAKTA